MNDITVRTAARITVISRRHVNLYHKITNQNEVRRIKISFDVVYFTKINSQWYTCFQFR